MIHYSLDAMRCDLNKIIRQMHLKIDLPTYVIGITRGGLIPATYLSHYFEIPLLTLSLSLRDNKSFVSDNQMQDMANLLYVGHRVLIIDDICDSGATLKILKDKLDKTGFSNRIKTAVLVYNEGQDIFTPDYIGLSINKHSDPRWIIFPWENWWQA